MKQPWVLGHRGAPRVAPENTMAAFRAALAQGAAGIELDVRLARTGELVVCHDPTLARVSKASVRVAATSAWALRRYDLGTGERVPLLSEVLSEFSDKLVNIEVKSDDGDPKALVIALARELAARRGRGPRVIVSAFEPAVLCALRVAAPSVERGLLLPTHPLAASDVLARSRGVCPHAIHPHHSVCTKERVRAWRSVGLCVNTWTVDLPEDAVRVAEAGVTGIITNEPGIILAALLSGVE